jgi:hypothetical protein
VSLFLHTSPQAILFQFKEKNQIVTAVVSLGPKRRREPGSGSASARRDPPHSLIK